MKNNLLHQISIFMYSFRKQSLKYTTHIFHILFAASLLACSPKYNSQNNLPGYDISSPNSIFYLPETLREVSGITVIDTSTVACIQDEQGIIFIYDLFRKQINKQYSFAIDGDYEGITKVNNTIFVLRSDGTLFEIENYSSPDFKMHSYATGIPANNNEGLCYDQDNDRLLIACKGKIGKGKEFKDKRVIYAFSLQSKKLSKDPVFDFDLKIIKQFALENNIKLPQRAKKGGKYTESIIRFRTSAICIHPIEKKLFLLSASEHLLFVFDMNGKIEHIQQLKANLFNKAEGITFLNNGDMLITNEGQDKKPTLLRFNYHKK